MQRFFAKSGEYQSYGMFTTAHLVLAVLSVVCIILSLIYAVKKDDLNVKKNIRWCTGIMWTFEIIKIIFNFVIGNANRPNTYVPLYFCSIPLYGGIFAGYGKGTLKKFGDVFLVVGGIIGGIVYIISPSSTASEYPAFHYITVQSFFHHAIMVYLGMIMVIKNYVDIKLKDIHYYALPVVAMSVVAYVVNIFLNSNLMFVSQNFPGTAIEILYNANPGLFPVSITLLQAIPPFFLVYYLINRYKKISGRNISSD